MIEYLEEFWDMEKSPYLKELEIRGKRIHFHYSQTNIGYIERHWKLILKGKKVGEVTRDDINQIFYDKEVMKHASRSVRGIVNAIVQPMKYTYSHCLTDINCYDGLIKPAIQYAKR